MPDCTLAAPPLTVGLAKSTVAPCCPEIPRAPAHTHTHTERERERERERENTYSVNMHMHCLHNASARCSDTLFDIGRSVNEVTIIQSYLVGCELLRLPIVLTIEKSFHTSWAPCVITHTALDA